MLLNKIKYLYNFVKNVLNCIYMKINYNDTLIKKYLNDLMRSWRLWWDELKKKKPTHQFNINIIF